MFIQKLVLTEDLALRCIFRNQVQHVLSFHHLKFRIRTLYWGGQTFSLGAGWIAFKDILNQTAGEPKFMIHFTHARTNRDHNNAILFEI